MGWQRYWQGHTRKKLCNHHLSIDSFDLFRDEGFRGFCVEEELKVELVDGGLQVKTSGGSYFIALEKMPGTKSRYFHCPGVD